MSDTSEFDNLSKELSEFIRQFREKLGTYLPPLRNAVDNIIAQESSDTNAIGSLLDSISSLMYAGIGHQLYLRLLEYYKTVDSEGADFYWRLYEEITE